jgi:hypothetical protein
MDEKAKLLDLLYIINTGWKMLWKKVRQFITQYIAAYIYTGSVMY